HHEEERAYTRRRAPTDYDADHVLLRLVRCVNGEVQVNLDCEPVFDYGRSPAHWDYDGPGYHEAVGRGEGADTVLRLTTSMRKGSRTSRPERSSPQRPPRSRKHQAASATGTTATPGSATRPSCCGACTAWASTGRRTTSSTSSPRSPRRRRTRSRSCTASAARP